jgi:hypothetical protein
MERRSEALRELTLAFAVLGQEARKRWRSPDGRGERPFTSVVCAESITDTSSSSGERNFSAIVASGWAAARRSMIGRMRSRRRPTGRRASRT